MQQKGAIHYDEAAVVNLTVVAPGGPKGARTAAVGSHLDPALVERMLAKLHTLVATEIGADRLPFDLDLFGTRAVKYRTEPMPGAR